MHYRRTSRLVKVNYCTANESSVVKGTKAQKAYVQMRVLYIFLHRCLQFYAKGAEAISIYNSLRSQCAMINNPAGLCIIIFMSTWIKEKDEARRRGISLSQLRVMIGFSV